MLQKNQYWLAEKILPQNWHFLPNDFQKSQKFYEDILIDTKSIAVKHYK